MSDSPAPNAGGNTNFMTKLCKSDAQREVLVRRTVILGLLAGCSMSLPLWGVIPRDYPQAPLLPQLSSLQFVEPALAVFTLVCLVLAWFKRRASIAVCFALCCLCLLDQTRFQPWIYIYTLAMIGISIVDLKKQQPDQLLNSCRLMFAGIYFWSGIHKLNWTYSNLVFPWIAGETATRLAGAEFITSIAPAGAILEALMGVGLLFKPSRPWALGACILLHLLLLLRLGPLSFGWNSVVWPWNATMIMLVTILFFNTREIAAKQIVVPKGVYHILVMLLTILCPALSYIGCWDFYPSFHLYSGDHQAAEIHLAPDVVKTLPDSLRRVVQEHPNGENTLHFEHWANACLNVPPYPEERVYRAVSQSFCKKYNCPQGTVMLELQDRPSPQTGERKKRTVRP